MNIAINLERARFYIILKEWKNFSVKNLTGINLRKFRKYQAQIKDYLMNVF